MFYGMILKNYYAPDAFAILKAQVQKFDFCAGMKSVTLGAWYHIITSYP